MLYKYNKSKEIPTFLAIEISKVSNLFENSKMSMRPSSAPDLTKAVLNLRSR